MEWTPQAGDFHLCFPNYRIFQALPHLFAATSCDSQRSSIWSAQLPCPYQWLIRTLEDLKSESQLPVCRIPAAAWGGKLGLMEQSSRQETLWCFRDFKRVGILQKEDLNQLIKSLCRAATPSNPPLDFFRAAHEVKMEMFGVFWSWHLKYAGAALCLISSGRKCHSAQRATGCAYKLSEIFPFSCQLTNPNGNYINTSPTLKPEHRAPVCWRLRAPNAAKPHGVNDNWVHMGFIKASPRKAA